MRRFSLHRFSPGVIVALVFAIGLVQSASAQDPGSDDRLRALEEQNRLILERLKAAETRNANLEGELKTLREEAVAPRGSEQLETQVNALSGRLADGVTWKQMSRSGFPFKFYGFLRMDAYYNTARMDNQTGPQWVRNESNGEAKPNDNDFALDARLTRFGWDIDGGKICNTTVTGKIELDFGNTPVTIESRETPRMRVAYLNLKFDKSYLRIGQDWDVISPLYPAINAETLQWNAGNLGDRRPQVQWGYASGDPKCGAAWDFKLAAGLNGAISNQDLDPVVAGVSNERDGFDSGMPNLEARVGVQFKSWVCDQTVSLGAWGAYGRMETDTLFNNEDRFDTWVLGVDWQVPLFKSFKLRGEAWAGSALSDFRGGIAQSVNTALGREIDSMGGWAEVVFEASKKLTLSVGATIDNPDNDDLSTNNRDLNWSAYIASKYDFGGGLKAGLDVIYWETQYVDTGLGNTVRFDIYTQWDF